MMVILMEKEPPAHYLNSGYYKIRLGGRAIKARPDPAILNWLGMVLPVGTDNRWYI